MSFISTLVQRFSGNTKVKAWHVFQVNGNHCVVGTTRMLGLYLCGKNFPTKVVVEAIEAAAGDGESIEEGGAKLASAIKALRKLGVSFRRRHLNTDKVTYSNSYYLKKAHWFKSTKSFEGKMVFLSDEQTYSEPHAVLIYRDHGVLWFFDCAQPLITGLYVITEEKALGLINASEETFVVSRR